MKGIQFFRKSPFFGSMATAAKFVQLIPIFLAFLVPLDVDVVPIKFHQFLFGEKPAIIIFVFFIFFLHFDRFHGNGNHFGKINP
jgi:hypothetical protein